MTPRLRAACIRLLEACDSVLSVAWSRLNPTVEDLVGEPSDSLDEPEVYASEDGIAMNLTAWETLQRARVAELTWRLNYRRREYAAHGCQPYERDGATHDLVFVPGPKGSGS